MELYEAASAAAIVGSSFLGSGQQDGGMIQLDTYLMMPVSNE